jgi:hypothetical protein
VQQSHFRVSAAIAKRSRATWAHLGGPTLTSRVFAIDRQRMSVCTRVTDPLVRLSVRRHNIFGWGGFLLKTVDTSACVDPQMNRLGTSLRIDYLAHLAAT